jgi:hypothetical protein
MPLTLREKILAWFITGETGMSSECLAATVAGMNTGDRIRTSSPSDGSDFGRCHMLILRVPEIRERLQLMRPISPRWNALVEHWAEVESTYVAERKGEPTVGVGDTYKLLRKIYAGIESDKNVIEISIGEAAK